MKRLDDRPDLSRRWAARRNRKIHNIALQSSDITLEASKSINIAHEHTILKSEGYDEKVARRHKGDLSEYANWNDVEAQSDLSLESCNNTSRRRRKSDLPTATSSQQRQEVHCSAQPSINAGSLGATQVVETPRLIRGLPARARPKK